MLTATVAAVEVRLEIAPPQASRLACSSCRRVITSRVSVRYAATFSGSPVRLVLRLCRRCFALCLLLDADLPGGGDCPTFKDLETVGAMLDQGAP